MTKDQLLALLADLGQSSLDGLAWLMGETERSARGLFLVAHDELRAALNEKARFDPKGFFDLVVTSEGDVRSLEEVKKAAARPGVSCVLISVSPLAPLTARELEGIRDWDKLDATKKDALFTGPLAQLLRLQPKAKGKKAPSGSLGVSDLGAAAVAGLVRPQLDSSVVDIEATPGQLPANPASETPSPGHKGEVNGTGVIVGVIDFGCDFVHPNFRMADGDTRLLSIWDQNEAADWQPSRLGRVPGRLYSRKEIDWALDPSRHPCPTNCEDKGSPPSYVAEDDQPYWRLGYDPDDGHYIEVKVLGGTHGTHVLDIAAGNGRAVGSGPPRNAGVAPNSELMFVQLAKTSGTGTGGAIDMAHLLMGILHIFREADRQGRPAVVNISLNGNSGPHDGTSLYDTIIEWLLLKAGRCVTVAAGNFRHQGCHGRRIIQSGDHAHFGWLFPQTDLTRNRVQFWTDSDDSTLALEARVAVDQGPPIPLLFRAVDLRVDASSDDLQRRLEFDSRAEIWMPAPAETVLGHGIEQRTRIGEASIRAARVTDSGQRRLVISLSLEPVRIKHVLSLYPGVSGPDGLGTIAVELLLFSASAGTTPETLVIDGWIERDDFRVDDAGSNQADQSRFRHGHDTATLGSLSCGKSSLVVGAYYETNHGRTLWHASSLGPTRGGRQKPDLSAPGRHIRAARSKGFRLRYPESGSGWRTPATIAFSGTSMAAPHVAGVAALLLQVKPDLTAEEIGRLLRENVQDDGRPRRWNSGFGFGRVSAAKAVEALLAEVAGDGAA